MSGEHGSGPDPDLAEAVAELRTDSAAVVPPRIENELVAAFRVHRATAFLRDDEAVVVPPQLESRLVAAFHQHQAPGIAADPSSRSLPWHLVRAAVVVAAVGGALWLGMTTLRDTGDRSRLKGGSSASARQTTSAPAPRPSARLARGRVPERPATAMPQEPAARPLSGRALAGVSTVAAAPDVEGGTDLTMNVEDAGFVPLSYGASLAGEPAHVVRVQVPRAALFDFGAQADVVPGEGDAVSADVLLSEDGMPRGIRFVDRFSTPASARPAAASRVPVPTRRR